MWRSRSLATCSAPTASPSPAGDPPYTAADVEEGFEQELLLAWWKAAAASDPAVVPPDADDTLVATPRAVQAALRALFSGRSAQL